MSYILLYNAILRKCPSNTTKEGNLMNSSWCFQWKKAPQGERNLWNKCSELHIIGIKRRKFYKLHSMSHGKYKRQEVSPVEEENERNLCCQSSNSNIDNITKKQGLTLLLWERWEILIQKSPTVQIDHWPFKMLSPRSFSPPFKLTFERSNH